LREFGAEDAVMIAANSERAFGPKPRKPGGGSLVSSRRFVEEAQSVELTAEVRADTLTQEGKYARVEGTPADVLRDNLMRLARRPPFVPASGAKQCRDYPGSEPAFLASSGGSQDPERSKRRERAESERRRLAGPFIPCNPTQARKHIRINTTMNSLSMDELREIMGHQGGFTKIIKVHPPKAGPVPASSTRASSAIMSAQDYLKTMATIVGDGTDDAHPLDEIEPASDEPGHAEQEQEQEQGQGDAGSAEEGAEPHVDAA